MANNSGPNAKTSCNPNSNSLGEQFECSSSSFSQLTISQAGSELKVEAGTFSSTNTSGSALGQQGGGTSLASESQQQPQKSPHINQYWAYSQLPPNQPPTATTASSNQATSSINQQAVTTAPFNINTSTNTGTVFSRQQDRDNVSPPAKELSCTSTGLVGPTGIITTNIPGYRASTSLTAGQYDQYGHGHFFSKKTFHRPTYCNHCSDLLWGLIGQGCICEVCNFVVHDRCLKTVVSPCSTVAPNVIKVKFNLIFKALLLKFFNFHSRIQCPIAGQTQAI